MRVRPRFPFANRVNDGRLKASVFPVPVCATAITWILEILLTMRRRVRRWRGQCLRCGYDLRGARHERCPECGAETEDA